MNKFYAQLKDMLLKDLQNHFNNFNNGCVRSAYACIELIDSIYELFDLSYNEQNLVKDIEFKLFSYRQKLK